MGSINQLQFIARRAARFQGPFLEVGSKDYGNTQPLRRLFAERGAYCGVDLEPGPGVDCSLDLTDDFARIDAALEGRRFGSIFCLSVLEHCRRPAAMAENLTRLLAPEGLLCVSVPFAFMFHGYPSDYWRFTHEGVKLLFADLCFPPEDTAWFTSGVAGFHPLDASLGKLEFGTKAHWRRGRWVRGVAAKLLGLLGKAGPLRWLAGTGYVLAPTEILMVGRRAAAE